MINANKPFNISINQISNSAIITTDTMNDYKSIINDEIAQLQETVDKLKKQHKRFMRSQKAYNWRNNRK